MLRHHVYLLGTLFVMGTTLLAQPRPKALAVGDPFPRLEGEFLNGKDARLPEAAQGKPFLIIMGFTYASRTMVEPWFDEARKVLTPSGGRVYQVPVIGGLARLSKWFINSGMRRGTPTDLHENVMTVWGGVDEWKQAMGYVKSGDDDAYLVLVGADGRVRWLHHGAHTAAAETAMLTALKDAE